MQSNGIQLTNVSVEKNESGLVSITVEVAPATVQDARTRVIKEFSKRLRIPGFRPGSVPAGIVRRNVGDQAIAQEVSDQLVPAAYQAALEQSGVTPLEQAQVDELAFDAFDGEKPLSFVARVIARPEIELGSTEGLSAVKRTVAVTDEDVDGAIGQMREEAAYLKNAPERPVAEGDVLFAEVQVYVDGAPRSEEPANLRGFVVGESGFVPAIDEHLVGMNLDETKKFPMSYPEEFPDAELAGKEAEFEVKVTAIKERVVPELTDEFAQIRQASDIADLKEKVKVYLENVGEREARKDVREAITKQVVEASNLDVPGALVDLRVGERIQGIQQELAQNNATLEAYLTAINSTQEQLESDLKEEIEGELKTELVLDEIARQQNFPVTREEATNHYLLMANVTNTPPEELVQQVPYQSVVTAILQRKAIDFLTEQSNIEDEDGNVISLDTPAMQDEAEEAIMDAAMDDLEGDFDGEEYVVDYEATEVVEAEGGPAQGTATEEPTAQANNASDDEDQKPSTAGTPTSA